MAVRILIVDDDAVFRQQVLKPQLERCGYQVLEAGRLHEADDVMKGLPPDLMILDGLLPDGSGAEYVAQLRRRGIYVPIIFVSAFWKDAAAFRQLTDLGVREILTKPIQADDLLARIENLLRGKGSKPPPRPGSLRP